MATSRTGPAPLPAAAVRARGNAPVRPGLRARLHARLHGWMRPRAPEALPVVLDRRRIYVLPTGFGLFLGVLLVAMGLAALNENNNPALLLVLLLAGAAQSALLATHLQLSGLAVEALDAPPVFAGQPLCLRLHLADRGGSAPACSWAPMPMPAASTSALPRTAGWWRSSPSRPSDAVGKRHRGSLSPTPARSAWRGHGRWSGPNRHCWSIRHRKPPARPCPVAAKACARGPARSRTATSCTSCGPGATAMHGT